MQARGPPRNVIIFPNMLGMEAAAAFGIVSHLSGLNKSPISKKHYKIKIKIGQTHLNSRVLSPHIDFARFRARMGTNKDWPFLILQGRANEPPNPTRNSNSRDSINHSSILILDRFTER